MNFKNVYATLLCVVAIGLTSCSSELNNDETNALNPNENAAREVTVSASKGATTRSIINLNGKAQWEKGDAILAYNLANPQGFDQLHARTQGVYSKFDGSIKCKVGDDLAFFYPYQDESKGTTPGTLELNMQENTIEKDGVAVTKVQDGTRETLNHFDYTWGTLKNINFDGPTLLQDIEFSKQYSILKLDFKYEGLALKNIKKLTIKGITTKATFDLKTGKFTNRVNDGLTIVPPTPVDELYVMVFPDDNFEATYIIETADNKTYTIHDSGFKLDVASYYAYTVEKVIDPWIDVDGVKWGKYNLQYEPGTKVDGWRDAYHLAKNPWDFFYTESYPLYTMGQVLPRNFGNDKFDHFRWGDIAKAPHYGHSNYLHYWTSTQDIQKQASTRDEFGDLAYYASNKTWRMPSKHDFEHLMSSTVGYLGYYIDGGKPVIGVLYVPTNDRCLKGTTRWIGGSRRSNINYTVNVGVYGTNCCRLYNFTKVQLENGVFLPFAGSYQTYNDGCPRLDKPGSQALYWTSTGSNWKQATAFTAYYHSNGCLSLPVVSTHINATNPKSNMYSIRPIFIGEQQKYKK